MNKPSKPNKKKDKSFSVTISKEAKSPKKYEYFLIDATEEYLKFDVAQKNETADSIDLIVKQSFAIPADSMKSFCLDVIEALIKYEAKYKNGKGLALPQEEANL